MLDFMQVATKQLKNGTTQIYPKLKVYPKPKDLLVRGKDFYAVWNEYEGMWSTSEDACLELIDRELTKFAAEYSSTHETSTIQVLYMWDAETGMIDAFHKFCQKQMRDNYHQLDESLVFSNTEVKRENYASKKLPYPLEAGDISAWDKIIGTLYTPEERHKIEYAIGAIVSGDSKELQKFMVLYGAAGTGKSTILNIVEKLFEGYICTFDAKALGQANSQFSLEPFKNGPLVAIQHDGDLSRIEDNVRLNSLISHETLTVNEKFKGVYENKFKCFLFLGTNRPVKITDAKSGLLRRLIDVSPSGNKLKAKEYRALTKQVQFELGAIAQHCLDVYMADPGYYDDYIPISMLGASNDFYNFVGDSYTVFKKEDGTTLKAAWEMYKNFSEEGKFLYSLNKTQFKEELKNYFWDFEEVTTSEDGTKLHNYYRGFRTDKFETADDRREAKKVKEEDSNVYKINFESGIPSEFDKMCADCYAQYASIGETPQKKWEDVTKKLTDIKTDKLHYVKVPENHIVIDFDIKDIHGNKSFEKNLIEASKWPPTYAELSKSGGGIHLHYIYTGDPLQLSRIYEENIEIKVFNGNSSLRRKLTKCNNLPIATISSGLPLKGGDKKMMNFEGLKSEKALRTLIMRHVNKEIMGSTAPSVQMIYKILEETYDSGLCYDVSDMENAIFSLAVASTNQSDECIKLVEKMKFKSEEASETTAEHDEIVFFDIEVFPNLFLVNWKIQGEGKPVVRMINPKPSEIEELIKFKLVGFNNRKYDNHMIYGCLMGYNNEQLYKLSQKLIVEHTGFFNEAYRLSYTDIYDFAAKKQSLKKWEIELGLHHHELGKPWDEPVPEEEWEEVAEYCDSDVIATEAVFDHLKGDFTARQILADLAGMTVNDTTNTLTTKIIFGNERRPKLVYTDLTTGEQFY